MTDSDFTAEELASEEWRTTPRYPSYQASSLGRIRRTRAACGTQIGRVLKPYLITGRYLMVMLHENRTRHRLTVHTLIAATFLGPRPDGLVINHLDSNPKNNRPDNLEYCTQKANIAHAHKSGRGARGEKVGTAKLSDEQAKQAIQLLADGMAGRAIARLLNVDRRTITFIKRGLTWKHLPRIE